MGIIYISTCCKADANEDYKPDPRDKYEDIDIYVCSKCKKECEVEDVCEDCRGTGEVTTMEQVYPNEPHTAPIGTEKCHCQSRDNDDWEPND